MVEKWLKNPQKLIELKKMVKKKRGSRASS